MRLLLQLQPLKKIKLAANNQRTLKCKLPNQLIKQVLLNLLRLRQKQQLKLLQQASSPLEKKSPRQLRPSHLQTKPKCRRPNKSRHKLSMMSKMKTKVKGAGKVKRMMKHMRARKWISYQNRLKKIKTTARIKTKLIKTNPVRSQTETKNQSLNQMQVPTSQAVLILSLSLLSKARLAPQNLHT